MAIKRQLVTSIVRNNEDYLGKVGLALIRQELASVFISPVLIRKRMVFCVVVASPYYMDE